MKKTDKDITDNLSKAQLKELKSLAEEDETKDAMTMDEYIKATKKWRTDFKKTSRQ